MPFFSDFHSIKRGVANLIFGFLIPLIGTTLGAFLIFFIKGQLSERKIKLIQGFAAGVMMAASIWSLILPALELSGDNPYTCYIPTTIGFVLGMNFLMLFDWFYSKRKTIDMMNLAVVIHNIPEGLSVGVAFAAVMVQSPLALTSAYALSFGIGIQNEEGKMEIFSGRFSFRDCRADCQYSGFSSDLLCSAGNAVFSIFCGRGDDLCGRQ